MQKMIVMLACSLLIAAPVQAGEVPDTGQSNCYDGTGLIGCPQPGQAFYGQDANYQGPARSYTKLGAGGAALAAQATQAGGWLMTRDNATGLVWEMKTDDNSVHDWDTLFSWCDTNTATNGGNSGTCNNNDTMDLIYSLNIVNFGGYADWRLPTVKELSTLVDMSRNGAPFIDPVFFPYTKANWFWSSSTHASFAIDVWCVGFHNGLVWNSSKVNNYYVRAVRGGQ